MDGQPARMTGQPFLLCVSVSLKAGIPMLENDIVQESYYDDIEQAEAQERNLIMEKYAYMMEETDPGIFLLSLRNCFQKISEEKTVYFLSIDQRFRKKNS